MNLEKRKNYIKNYKIKNKQRILAYQRKYYAQKGRNGNKIGGTFLDTNTSGLGRKYEKIALKLLNCSTDCNANTFAGGYDIQQGNKNIEVKMRNINTTKHGWNFSFKKGCTANWCLLFCVDTKIQRILLMPYKGTSSFYIPKQKNRGFDLCITQVAKANKMLLLM
jgi:hypothetical protein